VDKEEEMRRIIFLILILFFVNYFEWNSTVLRGEQVKERISDEILKKVIAEMKEEIERDYYWGGYELNEEIELRIIYSYVDIYHKKMILVLIVPDKEIAPYKQIEVFEVKGNELESHGYYPLLKGNRTDLRDENNEDIGKKFFQKDAIVKKVKIEGTYSIPPIKVETELQRKEIKCIVSFIKKLIKERGWESKFPGRKVNAWLGISEKGEEFEPFPIYPFFIENDEGWGFFGHVELDEERKNAKLFEAGGPFRSEFFSKPTPHYIKRMKEYFVNVTIEISKWDSTVLRGEQFKERISDEILKKVVAIMKKTLEESYYWGKYKLNVNEEIELRIIYSYVDVYKEKVILVLIVREGEIWPFKFEGNEVEWRGVPYTLHKTYLRDEHGNDIGKKFFQKDAIVKKVKIEGTYSIPPIKVETELQRKEIKCIVSFIKRLIKERGWESKFPGGKVNAWLCISRKGEEFDPFPLYPFFIENDEGWGFLGYVELDEERKNAKLFEGRSLRSEFFSKPTPHHIKRLKDFYVNVTIDIGKN
jgi:hypothetical protein